MEIMERDPIFAEVLKAERDYWGDNRNRFLQWKEEKQRLAVLTELRSAERRSKVEAIAEGIAVGEARDKAEELAESIAVVEARGKAEGMAEERRKMARSLLEEKTPLNVIQKVTGLTKDEISSLR
jgi:hypothetical protein